MLRPVNEWSPLLSPSAVSAAGYAQFRFHDPCGIGLDEYPPDCRSCADDTSCAWLDEKVLDSCHRIVSHSDLCTFVQKLFGQTVEIHADGTSARSICVSDRRKMRRSSYHLLKDLLIELNLWAGQRLQKPTRNSECERHKAEKLNTPTESRTNNNETFAFHKQKSMHSQSAELPFFYPRRGLFFCMFNRHAVTADSSVHPGMALLTHQTPESHSSHRTNSKINAYHGVVIVREPFSIAGNPRREQDTEWYDRYGEFGWVFGEMLMAASRNAMLAVPFNEFGVKWGGFPRGGPTVPTTGVHDIFAVQMNGCFIKLYRLIAPTAEQMDAIAIKDCAPQNPLIIYVSAPSMAKEQKVLTPDEEITRSFGWDLRQKDHLQTVCRLLRRMQLVSTKSVRMPAV